MISSVRGSLLSAVAAALLLAACGGPEGGGDSQAVASLSASIAGGCAPNEKCSAPARPVSPDALATAVVTGVYTGPPAAGFVDPAHFVVLTVVCDQIGEQGFHGPQVRLGARADAPF